MIDVHAHLTDEKLIGEVPNVLAQARLKGVKAIVDAGYDVETSLLAVRHAETYPEVFATVGIHPEEYRKASEEGLSALEKAYLTNERVVAIGEIGLDYHYPELDKEEQKKLFVKQIETAIRLHAPMVLHIRDALGDGYDILSAFKEELCGGVLLHCYSGSKEMVKQFDKFGCYYSFGGSITFKNAKDKPDVVRAVPFDRILTETDCPYMTPVPFRGQTNYPHLMTYSLEKMAEYLGKSVEEVDRQTTENAKRLFPRLHI